MTSLERCTQAARSGLKVFPLPSVVLFPASALPLHIFEPRYRDLVHDALAADGVIGLAQLQPGWESHYGGRPPLKPLCTVGVLGWHERLTDGRYNILVHGVARAEIHEELTPRVSYREVRATLLPDPAFDGPEEASLRQAVLEVASRVPAALGDELLSVVSQLHGGPLADAIASAVVPGLERRWKLLCERDVSRRMQGVLADLGDLMVRVRRRASQELLN